MITQFVLRTDKKDRARQCPVHLVVYLESARLEYTTSERYKPADWNADRQEFWASYPLAEETNALLARLAADTLAWWRKQPAAVPVAVPYEQYRETLRAHGYARKTLRQHMMAQGFPGLKGAPGLYWT